jgi:hypothetical protein
MDRTYPRELNISDSNYELIERIRDRIGDSIIFKLEYMTADESLTNSKLVAGGMTYYDAVTNYWPYNIEIDSVVYSGSTNPSVSRYQYLEFSTISGGTLKGRVIDFGLETFKLPDKTIWNTYQNVDLTGLVKDPDCITDYMIFLKACLDLCKILRTKRIKDDYSSIEVVDADTRFSKQGRGTGDPYKDLFTNIESELNKLIDECNKNALYWDGIRLE